MEQGYGEYAKLKEKGYNIAIIPADQRGKFMQRMESYNSAKTGGDKQTENVLYKGLVNEIGSLPEDFDTKKREGTKNLRIMYKDGVASMQRTSTLSTLQTTKKPQRTVSEIQAAFSSGKAITPEEDSRLIAHNRNIGMSTEKKQNFTQVTNDMKRQRVNRQRTAQKPNTPKLLAVSNQDNEALNKLIDENAEKFVNSTIDNGTPQTDTDINTLYSKYKNGGAVNEAEKQRLLMYMQNNIDSETANRENKSIGVSNSEPVSVTFSDKRVNTITSNNTKADIVTQNVNAGANEAAALGSSTTTPTVNQPATEQPNINTSAEQVASVSNPTTSTPAVVNNVATVNNGGKMVTSNGITTETNPKLDQVLKSYEQANSLDAFISDNANNSELKLDIEEERPSMRTLTPIGLKPAPEVDATKLPKLGAKSTTSVVNTTSDTQPVNGTTATTTTNSTENSNIGKSLMGVGNSLLNNMSAYANIAEGYFSKPEVEQAQRFETKPYEYAFSSQPQLKRAADIATVNAYNVGNNAGGNAQLANALKTQVNADLQTSVNSIYSPEVQQANSIRNMNTQQENTNVYAQNQENARVNDLNAANRAALRNVGRTGVGQLTQYAKQRTADMDLREQVNTQMANQKSSQDFAMSTLQNLYQNATFDIVNEVDENGKAVQRMKYKQTPSTRTKPVTKDLTVK
jgi:hypothetical protein